MITVHQCEPSMAELLEIQKNLDIGDKDLFYDSKKHAIAVQIKRRMKAMKQNVHEDGSVTESK